MYLLELYPNAPLKESMLRAKAGPASEAGAWAQTSDDDAADMYLEGLALTDAAGYQQYEISNVARPGRMSRHNLKYWQSGDWAGFGCGAHSTVDGVRWRNVAATVDYIDRAAAGEGVRLDVRQLNGPERLEEALFTGLRLAAGIDRQGIIERFAVDPWLRYCEELQPHVDEGLMWEARGRFGLTRRGMLVANEILQTFVSVGPGKI
jgi:oxygen-independent coproporphyrinogen-3 oxidase